MRLNEIYGKYRDQVRFYVIYIREAHPDDGWRVPENLRQNIRFREPRSEAERKAVATLCQINLDLQMPMLVDTIDNSVEESYIALPMRLYLIGRDGKIVTEYEINTGLIESLNSVEKRAAIETGQEIDQCS